MNMNKSKLREAFETEKINHENSKEVNDFEMFWNIYEKKQSKPQCKILWNTLSEIDKFNIFKFLGNYIADVSIYDREIPYTFLNDRIWELKYKLNKEFSIKKLMKGDESINKSQYKKKIDRINIIPIEAFDYNGLLKHPKWQRKRLEIMQRDNFTCIKCKDTETTLHIHHKSYEYNKKPWEYEDDNLITLCEDCHGLIEYIKKQSISDEAVKILKINNTDKKLFITSCVDGIKFYEKCIDEFKFSLGLTFILMDEINKFSQNG